MSGLHVRATGSHLKEQVLRFLRLFVAALSLQAVSLDFTHLGRSALISAGVGALEVTVRQIAQVVPVADTAAPIAINTPGGI